MKTYLELLPTQAYNRYSEEEKAQKQQELDELVITYQDNDDSQAAVIIFDELYKRIKGLIKGMAYRQAGNSFSIEQDDFEGIMNLVFVESLDKFDRSLGKPFQPYFIMNVKNEIKMVYRAKGYDIHDTVSLRLEKPISTESGSNTLNYGETIPDQTEETEAINFRLNIEKSLNKYFGDNLVKHTIVLMFVDGFKRNEIVSAIRKEGQSDDAVARLINRTINTFKNEYVKNN